MKHKLEGCWRAFNYDIADSAEGLFEISNDNGRYRLKGASDVRDDQGNPVWTANLDAPVAVGNLTASAIVLKEGFKNHYSNVSIGVQHGLPALGSVMTIWHNLDVTDESHIRLYKVSDETDIENVKANNEACVTFIVDGNGLRSRSPSFEDRKVAVVSNSSAWTDQLEKITFNEVGAVNFYMLINSISIYGIELSTTPLSAASHPTQAPPPISSRLYTENKTATADFPFTLTFGTQTLRLQSNNATQQTWYFRVWIKNGLTYDYSDPEIENKGKGQ